MHLSDAQRQKTIARALGLAAWTAAFAGAWAFFSFLNLNALMLGLWSGGEGESHGLATLFPGDALVSVCVCAVWMLCAARLVSVLDGLQRALAAAAGFSALSGAAVLSWPLLSNHPGQTPHRVANGLWLLGTALAPVLLAAVAVAWTRGRLWAVEIVAAFLFTARFLSLDEDWLRPNSEGALVDSSLVVLALNASTAAVAILLAYLARAVRLSPRESDARAQGADAVWLLRTLLVVRFLLFVLPGPASLFVRNSDLSGTWMREWFLRADAMADVAIAAAFIFIGLAIRRAGVRTRAPLLAMGLALLAAVGEQLGADNQPMFVLDRIFDVHLSLKVELWMCAGSELLVLGVVPVVALFALSQPWAELMERVPTSTFWWLVFGGCAGLFRAATTLDPGSVVKLLSTGVLTLFLAVGLWRFRLLVPALTVTAPSEEAAPAARASPG